MNSSNDYSIEILVHGSHCVNCVTWIISFRGHDIPSNKVCDWAPFPCASLKSACRQEAEVNMELNFLLFLFSTHHKMPENSIQYSSQL